MNNLSVRTGNTALGEEKGFNRTAVWIKPRVESGGSGSTYGAFYTMYTNADGDLYLLGGMVTGGTGNVLVPDILLWTAPAPEDPPDGVWEGAEGDALYLVVTGSGVEADGYLMPVYNVATATSAIAAAVPANTLPVVGDLTGKLCHLLLGTFGASVSGPLSFRPSAAGNFNLGFCFGGYTVART